MRRFSSRGFTIVELLIVIVIIAVFVGVVVIAYNNVQARARSSRAQSDIANLEKGIVIARINTGKTLREITGTGYTSSACAGLEPNMLPKTHTCWVRYQQTIDAISDAAQINLSALREGVQYGHPFFIDENEGESSSNPCVMDSIRDRGTKYSSADDFEITKNIAFSPPVCN